MPEQDFKKDSHKQSSAKYNFIEAIEAAIDIANHLILKKRKQINLLLSACKVESLLPGIRDKGEIPPGESLWRIK